MFPEFAPADPAQASMVLWSLLVIGGLLVVAAAVLAASSRMARERELEADLKVHLLASGFKPREIEQALSLSHPACDDSRALARSVAETVQCLTLARVQPPNRMP